MLKNCSRLGSQPDPDHHREDGLPGREDPVSGRDRLQHVHTQQAKGNYAALNQLPQARAISENNFSRVKLIKTCREDQKFL